MPNNKTLDVLIDNIKISKRSLVLSHQNPDGDTLGSMLALGAVLKRAGHVVDRVISDPVPEVYKFLPFADLVKSPVDSKLQKDYDLAFSLDCGSLKRLGKAKELWLKAVTTVNIDHHVSNEMFGKLNWIEPEAVSTGQLVYNLAKALKIKIDKDIATLLYTTLLTDTGCFSNSKTNSGALIWGAELINLGAEHETVYRKAFLEKPYKSIKVFGAALKDLNLIENGQVLWTCVKKDYLKELSATGEDTEDIADYMMRTKNVKVGVFFREEENGTKVSLRSNTEIDVSKIAMSLGGGGHKKAAGINVNSPLIEVKDLVLKKVIAEVKNIDGKSTK